MAIVHLSSVVVRCTLNPSLATVYDVQDLSFSDRWGSFLYTCCRSLVCLPSCILAGIATTPTESASLGALGALFAATAYGSLSCQFCSVQWLRQAAFLL
jgi:hypothetical protein